MLIAGYISTVRLLVVWKTDDCFVNCLLRDLEIHFLLVIHICQVSCLLHCQRATSKYHRKIATIYSPNLLPPPTPQKKIFIALLIYFTEDIHDNIKVFWWLQLKILWSSLKLLVKFFQHVHVRLCSHRTSPKWIRSETRPDWSVHMGPFLLWTSVHMGHVHYTWTNQHFYQLIMRRIHKALLWTQLLTQQLSVLLVLSHTLFYDWTLTILKNLQFHLGFPSESSSISLKEPSSLLNIFINGCIWS